jgi:16S rRNA (guanine(966)-N(2))-methyltransferase RsmD
MRVIAGELGGRVLKAPAGNRTRPTADRVREALFSVLGDVHGCNVLDLYAGTGALGIEALSRGASRAVFVENASDAIRCLRNNLSTLGLANRSVLVCRPVERARDELVKMAPRTSCVVLARHS